MPSLPVFGRGVFKGKMPEALCCCLVRAAPPCGRAVLAFYGSGSQPFGIFPGWVGVGCPVVPGEVHWPKCAAGAQTEMSEKGATHRARPLSCAFPAFKNLPCAGTYPRAAGVVRKRVRGTNGIWWGGKIASIPPLYFWKMLPEDMVLRAFGGGAGKKFSRKVPSILCQT